MEIKNAADQDRAYKAEFPELSKPTVSRPT